MQNGTFEKGWNFYRNCRVADKPDKVLGSDWKVTVRRKGVTFGIVRHWNWKETILKLKFGPKCSWLKQNCPKTC